VGGDNAAVGDRRRARQRDRQRRGPGDEQPRCQRSHAASIADLRYTRIVPRAPDGKPRAPKLRKTRFATDADIEIKGSYTAADAPAPPTSAPGEFPYTRGVQETMYRGQLWTMRQYAGFGTAAESNRRYKYLLAQGGKGLSVAFDLPTQMG